MTEVEALAKAMAAKAPVSLRYIKEAINKGLTLPWSRDCAWRLTFIFYCIPPATAPKASKPSSKKGRRNSKGNSFSGTEMSDFEVIIYEKKDNKGILPQPPQSVERLQHQMRDELFEALNAVNDDPEVAVVILKAAGERLFAPAPTSRNF